jgi:hypothetical protein
MNFSITMVSSNMLVTECYKKHSFDVSALKILPFHFHARKKKQTNKQTNKLQQQYIYYNITIFYCIKTNFKQTVNKGLELVS